MYTANAKDVLGFVGIGNMGRPMAKRLLESGHGVLAYDMNGAAVDRLVAIGARRARSAAEVASAASTVFLSLPASSAVRAVAYGADGLTEGEAIKCVIDFSTIGPSASASIEKKLAERGIRYVDAPVSGGVPGAEAGTLSLMVACAKELYDDLAPLLRLFGKSFYLGESAGMAQTMKLANNLLAAAAIAISSEAMVLGVKAGLDPTRMLEVINASSGRNSATQDKFPRAILPGTFDYGFGTGLSYKDVRLCIDEAESMGIPMVVGMAVREMLAITHSLYGPQSDYTSMCRVVESWAGVEVRS